MKSFVMNKNLIRSQMKFLRKKKFFTQHDVDKKQWKEENEQLKEENEQLTKENEQIRKNNVAKDGTIKESIKKPMEIKNPKEDKNMTDYYHKWFD